MPTYYFHLRDDKTLSDVDGTELVDTSEARSHAIGVARELMFNSSGMLDRDWSRWRMSVNDDEGKELFSFRMVDFEPDSSGKS